MDAVKETDEHLDLEISLPVTNVLKKQEKEEILRELRDRLAEVPDFEVVGTKYRELHGEGLPLQLIVNVTTTIANVIVIVGALLKLKAWVSKRENQTAPLEST